MGVFGANGHLLSEFIINLASEADPQFINEALELAELGIATFEKCLEALRYCQGDKDQAVEFILSSQ